MSFWEYLNARAMRNANLDLMTGHAQRDLSRGTLLVIAGVLYALFLGPNLDALAEKLLLVMLGGLVTAWAGQNQFWFGRPRSAGIPNPETTTTTTTTQQTTVPTPPAQPVIIQTPTTSPADIAAPAQAAADAAPKPPAGD